MQVLKRTAFDSTREFSFWGKMLKNEKVEHGYSFMEESNNYVTE